MSTQELLQGDDNLIHESPDFRVEKSQKTEFAESTSLRNGGEDAREQ